MKTVSVRVEDETKRRMEELAHLNWSELLRRSIRRRVELEESLHRGIDKDRALRAHESMSALRSKTSGRWSGAEEIRRWREARP